MKVKKMKFSKIATSQPRKKRKALMHAPNHLVKRLLRVHLGKDLRLRQKKRALLAKKGDKVRIVRGDHRKAEGKITEVDAIEGRLFIEGILQKKQGGKEIFAPIDPSNCILIEWNEPKRKEKHRKTGKTGGPAITQKTAIPQGKKAQGASKSEAKPSSGAIPAKVDV